MRSLRYACFYSRHACVVSRAIWYHTDGRGLRKLSREDAHLREISGVGPGRGDGGGAAASASTAGDGATAPLAAGADLPSGSGTATPLPPRRQPGQDDMDTKPYRILGDILKEWRERVSMMGDAVTRPEATKGELNPEA